MGVMWDDVGRTWEGRGMDMGWKDRSMTCLEFIIYMFSYCWTKPLTVGE